MFSIGKSGIFNRLKILCIPFFGKVQRFWSEMNLSMYLPAGGHFIYKSKLLRSSCKDGF